MYTLTKEMNEYKKGMRVRVDMKRSETQQILDSFNIVKKDTRCKLIK